MINKRKTVQDSSHEADVIAKLNSNFSYTGLLNEDCRADGRLTETIFNITDGLVLVQNMLIADEFRQQDDLEPLFDKYQRYNLMKMMLGCLSLINDHCYSEIQGINELDNFKKERGQA